MEEASKYVYFASDLHLGAPNFNESLKREKHFVSWLDNIKPSTKALYLVGDIFDFWFEYKHAIPKGYIRLLGKLAEFADEGIPIFIFTGNHDLWYKSYFPDQFGAIVYSKPIQVEIYNKHFYVAHGDGLGPGDHGYKFLKSILTNPLCKWLFERLHPNFGIGLANFSSGMSRHANEKRDPMEVYRGKKESLFIHAKEVIANNPAINYFVFGHRHVPINESIDKNSRMIILGDWINHFTYLKVGLNEVELLSYPLN